MSDSDGNWLLRNLPFGSYDVYITSNGYDTAVLWQIVSSGDTTYAPNLKLAPDPVRKLKVASVTWSLNPGDWPILVSGTVDTLPIYNGNQSGAIICFLDTVPDAPAKAKHFAEIYGQAGDSTWSAWSGIYSLDMVKFHSQMKLYVTAAFYAESGTGDGVDFNPYYGQGEVISPGPLSPPFTTIYPW